MPLTPQQRRTQRARETFAARFSTSDEKTEHFRELGQKSGQGRVVLSVDEVQALGAAYDLLRGIASRHAAKIGAVREDGTP